MAFKDLNLEQRLVAVHTDMLRHPEFCILGAVSQVGKAIVTPGFGTAGTDGADVRYDPEFCMPLTRKQLRYLVSHEQAHKMLRHCTEYVTLKKRYPQEFAMAVDYVVNWHIEELDRNKDFLERPTSVPPLIDAKYADKSVPEIIRDLLQQKDAGKAPPQGQPMDVHMDPPQAAEDGDGASDDSKQGASVPTPAQVAKLIESAVIQGEIVQQQLRRLAGTEAGNRSLSGFVERKTDWRRPLRTWFDEIGEGDDQSRFCPPNKRFLPLGFIMPSHFSEAAAEIIVACDTSGSMGHVYPLVFGEIAQIAALVNPKLLRVLWWDTKVQREEVYKPGDFASIRNSMKPAGGGGTTVSCVARYIRDKGYKPKGVILLTDGYVEAAYEVPQGNVLWGVVNHPSFRPLRGKVLHLSED